MDQEVDTDIWGAFWRNRVWNYPAGLHFTLATELKGHIPQTGSECSPTFITEWGRTLCSRSKLLKEINLTICCSFCHSGGRFCSSALFLLLLIPSMYPHPHRECFTLSPEQRLILTPFLDLKCLLETVVLDLRMNLLRSFKKSLMPRPHTRPIKLASWVGEAQTWLVF